MDREKITKNIEDKIQLGLVIAIFFPTVMASFYGLPSTSDKKVIMWFTLTAFYLAVYVGFQIIKRLNVSERFLRFLDWFTLASVGFFIFPITFMATADGNKIVETISDKINLYTFIGCLWGIMLSAVILPLIIGAVIGWKLGSNKK
jgi:hypothetical protein